jgi:hypothetical protein
MHSIRNVPLLLLLKVTQVSELVCLLLYLTHTTLTSLHIQLGAQKGEKFRVQNP